MKKVLLMVALVGLLAGPALAGMLQSAEPTPLYAGGAISASPRGVTYYDNTTTITASYSRPVVAGVGSEIGDELLMTNTETVYLDSVGFSILNPSTSAGPITTCSITVRFYNYDLLGDTFIYAGGLTWDAVQLDLPLGYYQTFDVADLYDALNPIALSNDVLATMQLTNITGGATRAGQMVANPPTVGASDDYFFRDGQLGWWFGGTPVANFYWHIDGVPEPMTLALLAVGALALIRRR